MIIGLCGHARAGKDSVGLVLDQVHGFARYAFADKLRTMALQINPWVATGPGWTRLTDLVKHQGWDGAKVASEDVRPFLQQLGTRIREVEPDFWVDHLNARLLWDMPEDAVITDVRFPNEAKWLKRAGGLLVRVSRPGVEPANEHEAESYVDDFDVDWEFLNAGDLDDLTFFADRLPLHLKNLTPAGVA